MKKHQGINRSWSIMKIKNIICFILSALIGVFSLAGCTESTEKYDIFPENSASNKTEKAAENRDDLNSIMKSWKIFNEAVSKSPGDLYGDSMVESIKQAMESEADNNRINIKLICSKSRAEEYKSIAGEFVWLFADDKRFNLNIEIFTSDDPSEKNISSPQNAPDIFFYNDSKLEKAVSSGATARINDNLRKFALDTDTAESIKAFTMNDKLYGMPTASAEGTFLVYDKRIYGENDISDLERMINIASRYSKNVLYALDDPYYSAGVFLAAGCSLENDGTMQTIEYNSKNGVAAAKAICSLANLQGKGFIGSGDEDKIIVGFSNGTICAAITEKQTAFQIRNIIGEENTGIAKLPAMNISDTKTQIHSFSCYEAVGVNPYSKFPFTSQLLAYYLSSERSQSALYYACGVVPAAALNEYSDISNDIFYSAWNDQRQYEHIIANSVSSEFYNILTQKNIGSEIVENNGNYSEEQLITYLSEIPLKIPVVNEESTGSETLNNESLN